MQTVREFLYVLAAIALGYVARPGIDQALASFNGGTVTVESSYGYDYFGNGPYVVGHATQTPSVESAPLRPTLPPIQMPVLPPVPLLVVPLVPMQPCDGCWSGPLPPELQSWRI